MALSAHGNKPGGVSAARLAQQCGDLYDERPAIRQRDGGDNGDEAGRPIISESVGNEDCGKALETGSRLVAPASWFARYESRRQAEPPFNQPCPDRCGRDERHGAVRLHFCVICGAWGSFGYGVFGDRPGRWYCFAHRPGE